MSFATGLIFSALVCVPLGVLVGALSMRDRRFSNGIAHLPTPGAGRVRRAGTALAPVLLVVILAGAAIAAFSPTAHADFTDGMAAYTAGDLDEARAEWVASADDCRAQYALGILYFKGQGVAQDVATARGWFERAALHGHKGAQVRLGAIHETDANAVEAYKWFTVAALQGHPAGEQKLDALTETMNDGEIAEGRARAKEWMEAHVDEVELDARANFLAALSRLQMMTARNAQ